MRATTLSLAPLLLAACVSGTIEARYFDPRPPEVARDPARVASQPVRLGRVTAAPYLRDRIAWRISENEVAFDEVDRWAAPPEQLVRDALKRYLVARNGFSPRESANAGAVDVNVDAFEVDRAAEGVLVRLDATLRRPSGPLERGTFEARQVARIDDPRSVAQAAGIALADTIRQLGDWLRSSLADTGG